MDPMQIEEARTIAAAVETGDAFEHAAAGHSSEGAHAWAAGVEYGIRAARAIAAADAGTAAAPALLRKSGTVELNAVGSGAIFEITQADVTFSMHNDVTGRQELNIMLVLERDVPPRDSGIRTSAQESGR